MHPEEAVLVEVAMDGHGEAVPDPGHRADAVRAHAQVGDLAQVLEGVVLGLDRVAVRVVDPADDIDRVGDQLDVLALALRGDERSADGDRAAAGQARDLVVVVVERRRGHDLERSEARSVVDVQEGEPGLRVTPGPDPALDGGACTDCRPAGQDVGDSFCLRHRVLFSSLEVARGCGVAYGGRTHNLRIHSPMLCRLS